ncbi:hypothetical protein BGZ82_000079 [Podila clonocystis]|nr:hypothetical protein BGZ82_000079 [Podila clonocystis]
MAHSNKGSSRIHDAPHHQKHVHASVEEDEDDGWQVVSSSKDSQSVSSKTSSSSSPSTEDDHPIATITDIPASETSVAPTDATTPEFKEKPPKAKKKIFGTDEFQPVVSKKQIARANKLAGVQRPNASVGISTSSYFDLLQGTEGEDVEEIVDRIREEEEEKVRLLLEEQEQEQQQERTAADIKEILEEEEAKRDAEIRAQQALELHQRQLEEEEEAKEQLLQQIAQQELERAKEEEEKLAAAAVEAEQKKQKEEKKQQQMKEKRDKELKEKEAAAAAAATEAASERAQKQEAEAQALAKDTREDEDTTEEPTETPTVDTVATPQDSWEIEEDDEWQQQSKSKKGRKTRGAQPGESSLSAVSDLQTKMPIYLLEQDEIQQDSDEEDEVSEEEQQRRDEEKVKAAAKAKAKAASNKKNKKKNNSNSNSAVSSPRMESRKKNVSANSSAVNSPRLEGKKSKKASTTSAAVTVEESSEATPKLINRGKPGSSTVEVESESQEKDAAEVQATEAEEGSTSMVSKDGSAGMVGGTLNSIFEKGVNPGLIKMLNLVFVALFLSLGFLIFASGGNLHVIALTGIAVALFVTIQWFLREMETMKIDERKNV